MREPSFLLEHSDAKDIVIATIEHLAQWPMPSAETFRNAVLGDGMIAVNPMLDIKEKDEADYLHVAVAAAVNDGQMIDFGFIPNELMKAESLRSRTMYEAGDLPMPYDNWVALSSEGWGRSEMAAQLYDEVLFENATFGDMAAKDGPLIMATATDISTGSRLGFVQTEWDLICSDLSKVPLSRAAAASSAVPLALSPVTINNYGGNCNYEAPKWVAQLMNPGTRSRPAGRALQRLKEMQSFEDSANRPYLHLVDGGISDNLGMRALLETLEELEASRGFRRLTKIEQVKHFVVVVVNSLSVPKTWRIPPASNTA